MSMQLRFHRCACGHDPARIEVSGPQSNKKLFLWEAVEQPLQKEQSSFVDIITSINSSLCST